MNFVESCLNALCSLTRLKRFSYYRPIIPLENSDRVIPTDNPRKIVSWNVQGLFFYMNNSKLINLLREIRNLDADVICLQEVFEDYLKYNLVHRLSDIYPYYLSGNLDKRYIVGEDSGLLVLSKYPLQFQKECILDDCSFPDTMSNKSILYFRAGNRNFATAHLQSSDIRGNTRVSVSQIQRIKTQSPFRNYLVCGDLNHPSAYHFLGCECNNRSSTCDDETLDYILPMGELPTKLYLHVPEIDITGCSDHKPLIAEIQ